MARLPPSHFEALLYFLPLVAQYGGKSAGPEVRRLASGVNFAMNLLVTLDKLVPIQDLSFLIYKSRGITPDEVSEHSSTSIIGFPS